MMRLGIWKHGIDYEHAVWEDGAYWTAETGWVGMHAHCCYAHFLGELSESSITECPIASQWMGRPLEEARTPNLYEEYYVRAAVDRRSPEPQSES